MPTEAIVKRPTHFEYDDFNLASNFELCVLMATLTENDLFGSSSEKMGTKVMSKMTIWTKLRRVTPTTTTLPFYNI